MKISYMTFWSIIAAVYVVVTIYTAISYNRVANSINNSVECLK